MLVEFLVILLEIVQALRAKVKEKDMKKEKVKDSKKEKAKERIKGKA